MCKPPEHEIKAGQAKKIDKKVNRLPSPSEEKEICVFFFAFYSPDNVYSIVSVCNLFSSQINNSSSLDTWIDMPCE